MSLKIQKPILVGGIAISAGLVGLDLASHVLAHSGNLLLLGTMAAGGGYWWWNKQQESSAAPVIVDRAGLEQLIVQIQLISQRLTAEGGNGATALLSELQQMIGQVDRQHYRVVVTGGARVGKTSTIAALPAMDIISDRPVEFTETPPLFEVDSNEAQVQALLSAADLVVFLTNGDLTATEFEYLSNLRQRLLVVLNKQDQFSPTDRATVFNNITRQVAGTTKNTLAISAKPAPIKVRAIAADGAIQESIEQLPAEIDPLTLSLREVLAAEGAQLVLATTYWEIDRLKNKGKIQLNSLRRERAMPIIEQRQWIAGATAFANPLPALDLLATAAVNAQTVVDLSAIYQQPFSIELGQSAASAMGGMLLKLGLVEFTTQTIGTVLKTNAVTYVAGGLLQGVSAAYLTRIVGLTLLEYFADQDILAPQAAAWHPERFGSILTRVFQANQRMVVFQDLVQQGVQRLVPTGKSQLMA
jgi:uncharacterized protein